MTITSPSYGSVTTITWTLNSLASDVNLLIGRASTAVDNQATDDALDALVGGQFVSHSTAPTTGKQIEVWAYGSFDGSAFNAAATGTDAGLTVTAESKTLMRLLTVIPTNALTSTTYTWGPFSIAQAFGGFVPRKWGLWATHNMGQILNAAGNLAKYTPVKVDIV